MKTTTKEERELLEKIADRASRMALSHGMRYGIRHALADVQLAHEARPLDLEGLLGATDFNFAHDVYGIRRHIDYRTGQMQDYFVPRYTAQGREE